MDINQSLMDDAAANNAAINFYPAAFSTTSRPNLMGRDVAGEEFLHAFFRHAVVDDFYCLASHRSEFEQFASIARSWKEDAQATWIPRSQPALIEAAGCLYHPDPVLGPLAWQRRHVSPRAYSICGVTHTICSAAAMDALGALITCPLHTWDALICTSTAVRQAVDRVLRHWCEYLRERLNIVPPEPLETPIIPLGVDCTAFAPSSESAEARRELRRGLGIEPADIVFLYVGRISFHAKAHPLPMYLALETAASQTRARLWILQAGWFPNASVELEFKSRAKALCPSVRARYLDGRRPDVRRSIWFAADIFVSLADNIQETFGLAPIEAMAAGLPAVVADWNGYRDTIRHGIDGFRIATLLPPGGAGLDLAIDYALGAESYDRYIGGVSQCTAVDVDECTSAFISLINNEALRRAMGDAARQRACERFDWRHVIRAYQSLWQELERRRKHECRSTTGESRPANPLREDPFALFSHYATRHLGPASVLSRRAGYSRLGLDELYSMPMTNFATAILARKDEVERILAGLEDTPRTIREILAEVDPTRHAILLRTLGWLAKAGLVAVTDAPGASLIDNNGC